jgi:WD40 repeat protein/serine/threonine protein kinase
MAKQANKRGRVSQKNGTSPGATLAPPNNSLGAAATLASNEALGVARTLDSRDQGGRPLSLVGDLGSADTMMAQTPPGSGVGRAVSVGADLPSEATRYEVEGELARGGLGRILKARDKKLGRPVAIKQLLHARGDQARFVYEAMITARLQHPAIVPVYEAGRWDDGDPYFAMKLVAGKPLDEVISATDNADERLGLLPRVIDVCEAIAYAHGQKIIHRDLKPQNVLLGDFGETVVIDWGLAKDLSQAHHEPASEAQGTSAKVAPNTPAEDSGPGLTVAGAVVGTPAYMPPEQAAGKPVDERADVYSLGAILYHLLAGTPPYQGKSGIEVLRALSENPPPPLRSSSCEVPPDLAAVVEKAMSRDPARRYPTAKELSEELRRFQHGQLVQAHRYTKGQRVVRFLRRNKAASLVALLALVLLGLQGRKIQLSMRELSASNQALSKEKKVVNEAKQSAEQAKEELRQQMVAQTLRLTREQLAHDPRGALFTLARAADADMQPLSEAQLSEARNLAQTALSYDLPREVTRHQGFGVSVSFTADSTRLLSTSADGSIRVSPLGGGDALVLQSPDTAAIHAALLAPSGALYSNDFKGALRRWDLSTQQARVLAPNGYQRALLLSPDGTQLAAAGTAGDILILDAQDGSEQTRLTGHQGEVRGLDFSPDGKWLASGGQDHTPRIWDLSTQQARVLPAHQTTILRLRFSPDGKNLYSLSEDGELRRTDLSTGATERLAPPEVSIETFEISPKRNRIAASDGASLWLLDISKPNQIPVVLRAHLANVQTVAFSPKEDTLASSDTSGVILFWDIETKRSRPLLGHHSVVWSLAFSPDGRSLASLDDEGRALLWTPQAAPLVYAKKTTARQLSANGKIALMEDKSGLLALVDLATQESQAVNQPRAPLSALALSADGEQFASADTAGGLYRFDRRQNRSQALANDGAIVRALAFSSDGKWLATGDQQRRVRLWELSTGTVRDLYAHQDHVSALAFSPDGARLASGGPDQTTILYNLNSNSIERQMTAPLLIVRSLAFSPDGRELAVGGGDGKLRRYDLQAPEQAPRVDKAHNAMITSLRYAASGKALLSLDADYHAHLWDLSERETPRQRPLPVGEIVAGAFSPDEKTITLLTKDGATLSNADDLPRGQALLSALAKRLSSL